MKRIWIALFFFSLVANTDAQRKADLGIFAGTAYYIGDINPSGHFKPLNPSIGVIYRHNFNPRHALRWNLFYGSVSADNPNLDFLYGYSGQTSFSSKIVDMSLQFEFNFTEFESTTHEFHYSTYIAGGAGVAIANKPGGFDYDFVLPLGLGIKMNLSKRIGAALQWEFRKTFFDDLDGVENLNDPDFRSLLHNNDWYSFAGIVITYKIFNLNEDCPAYWDIQY